MAKREKKSVAGHESDKLNESYSVQPTIEQQFESPSFIRRFITLTHVNSGQFNLFLRMGLIFSYTFSSYDFLSFHHSEFVTFRLVSAISRKETALLRDYLEITSSLVFLLLARGINRYGGPEGSHMQIKNVAAN